VVYAEGSDAVEPEQPLSFEALQAATSTLSAGHADAALAVTAGASIKQEAGGSSAMDMEDAMGPRTHGVKQHAAPTPAEQMQSFLDAIPD